MRLRSLTTRHTTPSSPPQAFRSALVLLQAQLHLFSTDTTDQVIIENTDAGLDTAPDLVLYRNSASPAASDNLGNLSSVVKTVAATPTPMPRSAHKSRPQPTVLKTAFLI